MISKNIMLEEQCKEKKWKVETTRREKEEMAKLEKALESKLGSGTRVKDDSELQLNLV